MLARHAGTSIGERAGETVAPSVRRRSAGSRRAFGSRGRDRTAAGGCYRVTLLMVSPSARGRDPGTERKRPCVFLGLPHWRMRPVSSLPTDSTRAASSGATTGYAARASAGGLRRQRRLHPAPTPSPGAGTTRARPPTADKTLSKPPVAAASALDPYPPTNRAWSACRVRWARPTPCLPARQPYDRIVSGPRRTRLQRAGFR